jgi:predicted GNAT family acetyltransferase
VSDVRHDERAARFVLEQDGQEVYTKYHETDETIDFVSTFTPPDLRGKGLARRVVDAGLAWARERGKSIRASCWYVDKVLKGEK